MKRRLWPLLLILFGSFPAKGAEPGPPPGTPLSRGLWWLYQLQYERAYALFDEYSQAHPKDPAGYFYKTATDWWQLAQQFDFSLPDIEQRLEKDFQNTARVSHAALEAAKTDQEKSYACLYWGGAEGLKGRWLVTQKQWIKAYFAGKKGASLLKRSVAYDPQQYDAYMGLGIYDYFTDTLGGVIGALSSLLIRGDKARGLRELQLAIDKAPHARVESMIFLIEIYTAEENEPAKALPIAQTLRKEFPYSPAMHLAEIMTLYSMKDWNPMMEEAQDFLEKSKSDTPWFTSHGIRPALYCLGVGTLWGKQNPDKALTYFNEILAQKQDSSRWITFSLLRRGQIYDMKGERDKARNDYQAVLARPNFWGAHTEAHRYLDKPFKSGER